MTDDRSPILIKNVHLFDPANDVDLTGNVFIRDGIIEDIGEHVGAEVPADTRIIEGKGNYLTPAFCDPHVHFRTPGYPEKEDIESGSQAALAGGFTTVIQMPNTNPTADSPEVVSDITRDEPIELKCLGAVTLGIESRELAPHDELLKAGAVGLTDDGEPVIEPVFMKAALDFSRENDVPVASHSEDPTIGLRGTIRTGIIAETLEVPGWHPSKESMMVERDCGLAGEIGGHVHFCHISTRQSVDRIREAKDSGIRVTAEVTPHHLALTVNDVPELGADGKMNPPLATDEDIDSLIEALADGTIDCIATDHAPHTPEEKALGLQKAPFGVIGLETSFAVCYTHLVKTGKLPFALLIEAMSTNPRKIYNLEAVGLVKGSRADLILLDTSLVWVVHPELFESKARNCPFREKELTGKVLMTIYRGRIMWEWEA